MPLAVETVDEHGGDEEDTHRDDQRGGDLVEDIPVVLEGATEARRGQAEDYEDHGEARHEQQTRGEHAAPIGLAQVLRGHSGDR